MLRTCNNIDGDLYNFLDLSHWAKNPAHQLSSLTGFLMNRCSDEWSALIVSHCVLVLHHALFFNLFKLGVVTIAVLTVYITYKGA